MNEFLVYNGMTCETRDKLSPACSGGIGLRLIISRKNLSEINNVYFHDAEIAEVISNYYKRTIAMPVTLYKKDGIDTFKAIITFENTVGLDISFLEPWGAGIYVLEVNAEPVEIAHGISETLNSEGYFKVGFLLNSGDKINVITARMIIDERVYLDDGNSDK